MARLPRLALDVEVDERRIDLGAIECDLFVARVFVGIGGCEFEAIEGAFAGAGLAAVALAAALKTLDIGLAREHGEQRIGAQLLVIVEVFVALRQAVDALPYELPDAVLNAFGIAMIVKTVGELPQNPGLLLAAMQQQRTGLGGDRTAVETGDHIALKLGGETETRWRTLCHSESRSLLAATCCRNYVYGRVNGFPLLPGEISGLGRHPVGVTFELGQVETLGFDRAPDGILPCHPDREEN